MAFSVGLGLTNACNLRCPHCYRPEAGLDQLTLKEVKQVCESIPISSLNLGVGENGLHPDFHAILDYLAQRGIKTSITSNGLSLQLLSDAEVKRFHSVELSLDFPNEREHDAFRGEGNWRMVMRGAERMGSLGLTVTITAVMMSINYRRLPRFGRIRRPGMRPLHHSSGPRRAHPPLHLLAEKSPDPGRSEPAPGTDH